MEINYLTKMLIFNEWLWLRAKPRQLSEKYGVSVNTIRSWHHREAWAYSKCAKAFKIRGVKIPTEDLLLAVQNVSEKRKNRIAETQKKRDRSKREREEIKSEGGRMCTLHS